MILDVSKLRRYMNTLLLFQQTFKFEIDKAILLLIVKST